MDKIKNLKKNHLNQVSGGCFVPASPVWVAGENYGLKSKQFKSACEQAGLDPTKVTQSQLDELRVKRAEMGQQACLTRDDVSFLKQWGVKF